MIEFISNEKSFVKCKEQKSKIFKENNLLPQMVFNESFYYFLFIDFDYIFEDSFFLNLSSFLRMENLKEYIFYVENPNPETYFYKHFKKFNVSIIPVDSEVRYLNNFFLKDPGHSPADAIIYNSFDIFLFSNDSKWGIVASRDLETAVIGFKDIMTKELFLKEFHSDRDSIDNLESFKQNMHTNNSYNNIIDLLIKNYK